MTASRTAPGSSPGQVLRYTLLAAAILLAAGCTPKGSDETAASEAAASAPAAAPAASATATAAPATSAASPADAAAAPAPAAAGAAPATTEARPNIPPPQGLPPGPTPEQDKDYTVIDSPTTNTSDKIQVTEVFGYGCPHCNALQPHLSAWEKKLPNDVQFQYLPAAFGSDPNHCWDDFARAFYAAQAMGFQAKSHDAIYKAVWDEKNPISGCAAIPSIFAKFGSDAKTIAATMQSFAVNAKVAAAHEQVVRWAVESTPTVVVDGKYKVIELTATGPDGMLHTIDWLIAKERQDRAKK